MTREEFKNIVKAIRTTYPNTPISTQQAFDLWYELIKDMGYASVADNLQRHIKTNKFSPTVAELRGVVDTKDFNNFKRRAYNMDALESELLEVQHRELTKLDSSPYLEAGQIEGGEYDSEK